MSSEWELKNIGEKGNRERERGGGVLLLLLFIQLAGDFSFLFSLVGFLLYYKNLPIGFFKVNARKFMYCSYTVVG